MMPGKLLQPMEDNRNKKITVLYVHANNEDVGGADYCLFKLAAELDREKFRPVVCLCRETEILELYRREGITTYVINMERIQKTANPLKLVKLGLKFFPTVLRLRKIIKEEQVDIVHGNDLLDIYGPVAGRLAGVPVTQYVRWILVSPVWLKVVLTQLVRRLNNCVITVSDGVAREMFSQNGIVHQNIITCYDWVDMDKVGHTANTVDIKKEYQIPAGVPVVGCVGRLEPWKGQDVFIKAAAKVLEQFPEAVFLVVGGGVLGRGRETFADGLKKAAERLKIDRQVIFTGHRSDIVNVMHCLDVFVHSSTTPDPLPGVVLESMCCGRPVIGAKAGGVSEEVADGVTGLLYSPGDVDQMAEKISHLLKNPETGRAMGEAGRQRVEQVFNKKVLCPQMENIYRGLVGVAISHAGTAVS